MEHAHCILQAGAMFAVYAEEHQGCFPVHTNGYGDALLLLNASWYGPLTGPGYEVEPFETAARNKAHLPEAMCGRVYVQGLRNDHHDIVILFDKVATPGGDHCHLFSRMWTPLCREVLYADGLRGVVKESEWADFAKKQVELLIAVGIKPEIARRYYEVSPPRG